MGFVLTFIGKRVLKVLSSAKLGGKTGLDLSESNKWKVLLSDFWLRYQGESFLDRDSCFEKNDGSRIPLGQKTCTNEKGKRYSKQLSNKKI